MNRKATMLARSAIAAAMALAGAGHAMAQGSFTAEQAARGQTEYNSQCGACHGFQLEGGVGPVLAGAEFRTNWGTAAAVHGYFSVSMPPQAPGRLSEQAYLDIMAHILNFNGLPAGDAELTLEDLPSVNMAALPEAAAPEAAPAEAPAAEAAPAAPSGIPQAYTWGQQLPTVGGQTAATPAAPAAPERPAIPQAYTWGQQLPTVTP
ncbi:c-type cytochrome [Arsenicitalea aurantiaca]|uniref:c-type cytochrome n=1 Tax=Arsenicitalea aurantiaca TaxID=1783274 RepID=UPI0013151655|nr:cytochrome c [Arsenicitalea aurantiaca]